MKKADVAEFFRRLSEKLPEPKTELEYHNAYTLLVAVVLSAQATDVGVNKATRPLFELVDAPQAMVELGVEKLRHYIRTIGLFNTKAKNVIELSRLLIERHGGQVPEDFDALVDLPGVGRKTASVVLNSAFGHPKIAVDTHIFRVANRTGLAKAATADKVSDKLEAIVPKDYLLGAHHWLILHGRYTCMARKPDCPNCVVADLCAWKGKTVLTE